MKTSRLLVVLCLAGCAGGPATGVEQAEIEYRRVDATIRASEEFEQRQLACSRAGGILRVPRSSAARQPARARDLRRAICERAGDFGGVY